MLYNGAILANRLQAINENGQPLLSLLLYFLVDGLVVILSRL